MRQSMKWDLELAEEITKQCTGGRKGKQSRNFSTYGTAALIVGGMLGSRPNMDRFDGLPRYEKDNSSGTILYHDNVLLAVWSFYEGDSVAADFDCYNQNPTHNNKSPVLLVLGDFTTGSGNSGWGIEFWNADEGKVSFLNLLDYDDRNMNRRTLSSLFSIGQRQIPFRNDKAACNTWTFFNDLKKQLDQHARLFSGLEI